MWEHKFQKKLMEMKAPQRNNMSIWPASFVQEWTSLSALDSPLDFVWFSEEIEPALERNEINKNMINKEWMRISIDKGRSSRNWFFYLNNLPTATWGWAIQRWKMNNIRVDGLLSSSFPNSQPSVRTRLPIDFHPEERQNTPGIGEFTIFIRSVL